MRTHGAFIASLIVAFVVLSLVANSGRLDLIRIGGQVN